jgi:predicted nucleic acid-binding protein
MILVDTSVIIDKLRKIENPKTIILDQLNTNKAPFGISILTFHEILQGAKSIVEFDKLHRYFSTQTIFALPNTTSIYTQSAKLYFDLRRQGVTVRSTIDVMIAFTAIHNKVPLLHNDSDYDLMAERIPELMILN